MVLPIRLGTCFVYLLLSINVREISSTSSDEDWSCEPDSGSSYEDTLDRYTHHYRPLFTCPRYFPYTRSRSHISIRPRAHNSIRPTQHFTSANIEPVSARFGSVSGLITESDESFFDPSVSTGLVSASGMLGSSHSRCRRSHRSELNRATTCERVGPRPVARGPRVAHLSAPEAERVRDRTRCIPRSQTEETLYSFELIDGNGKTRRLKSKRYRGKVLLIVVMATFHPLSPQILALDRLQQKYEGQLKILAFPTNQFRVTENGANHTEVMSILYYVRPGKYFVPTFDVYPPCAVNGAAELPLFSYLKAACPPTRTGFWEPLTDLKYDPVRDSDVRDAYEKFLVSGRGLPVARYDARVPPTRLDSAIQQEIANLNVVP